MTLPSKPGAGSSDSFTDETRRLLQTRLALVFAVLPSALPTCTRRRSLRRRGALGSARSWTRSSCVASRRAPGPALTAPPPCARRCSRRRRQAPGRARARRAGGASAARSFEPTRTPRAARSSSATRRGARPRAPCASICEGASPGRGSVVPLLRPRRRPRGEPFINMALRSPLATALPPLRAGRPRGRARCVERVVPRVTRRHVHWLVSHPIRELTR